LLDILSKHVTKKTDHSVQKNDKVTVHALQRLGEEKTEEMSLKA